jgi:hypothetical protein
MLTIFLQRKSSSIPTKEACPPVITAASPVTSDPKCPHLQAQKSKVQKELPTRATSGTLPSTAFQAPRYQQGQLKFVPANQSGKSKKNKSRRYKRKPQKPISNYGYEGLLSLMQCMLRRMDNMNKTCKPPPQVKQVWVRNDETIHPLRGSGLT